MSERAQELNCMRPETLDEKHEEEIWFSELSRIKENIVKK